MWEDNIKLDLEGVHWIHVTQGSDKWRAVVNTVMNSSYHKMRGTCSLP